MCIGVCGCYKWYGTYHHTGMACPHTQLAPSFYLQLLQDRRKVYDLLEASGIDVPRHVYVSRDGYQSTGTGDGNRNGETELQEFDDHIEINGVTIHKPFVEKPVDAEDHNIAIYYPTSAGGGCKKLFRKIGNRSSDFYPEINEVRSYTLDVNRGIMLL